MNIIKQIRSPRHEPLVEMPHGDAVVTPEVAAFIDSSVRQRAELARALARITELEIGERVRDERIHDLEHELAHVRDDRDRIYRHDCSIMTSLSNIEAIITDAKTLAKFDQQAPAKVAPAIDSPESDQ